MNGLQETFKTTITHYILLFVLTNNFDTTYLFWFTFSTMWLWVIGALEDVDPFSAYFHSVYDELLKSNLFWLQCFMLVTLSIMPIYFWLKWRQFFGGDPRHDFVYRANFLASKKI